MKFLKKLFGKSSKKKVIKLEKENDYDWLLDSLIQYVKTPKFENKIEDFLDMNCIEFQNAEESTHKQFLIHKKFISLVEKQMEELLNEFQITPEILYISLQSRYHDKQYRRFIGTILNTDDFLLFKKMMIKRNKQIEYEAQNPKKKRKSYEKQKLEADLQYAIELSKKLQEEFEDQIQNEEVQLKQAMEESKLTFKNEQQKQKKEKLKEIQEIEQQNHIAKQKEEEEIKKKQNKENSEARKKEIEKRLASERENLQKRLQDLKKLRNQKTQDITIEFKPKEQKNEIENEQVQETLEQRKNRIAEQREKLLENKRQERLAKLNNYLSKQEKTPFQQMSKKEEDKRKQIYEKVLKQFIQISKFLFNSCNSIDLIFADYFFYQKQNEKRILKNFNVKIKKKEISKAYSNNPFQDGQFKNLLFQKSIKYNSENLDQKPSLYKILDKRIITEQSMIYKNYRLNKNPFTVVLLFKIG